MGNIAKQLIISSIVAVLVFGIGYALFSDTITVSGTASTSGSMDIAVTGITVSSTGAGTNSTVGGDTTKDNQWNISADENIVTLTVNNLTFPGATATYTITLTNNGTVDAKLGTIVPSTTIEGLDISTFGIAADDVISGNGGTKTFTVTVKWDDNAVTEFTGEQFNIVYNFSQGNI